MLHAFRKVYDGPNRKPDGPDTYLVAVVCPACPAIFTLQELKKRTYLALMGRATPPRRKRGPSSSEPTVEVTRYDLIAFGRGHEVLVPTRKRSRTLSEHVHEIIDGPWPPAFPHTTSAARPVLERRAIHWVKVTDPRAATPPPLPGVDVRVLVPDSGEFDAVRERLTAAGHAYRSVRHLVEDELVGTVDDKGASAPLRAVTWLGEGRDRVEFVYRDLAAAAARDAFEALWESAESHSDDAADWGPAADVVPSDWLQFLPHTEFNPLQRQAAPALVQGEGHVVVAAPTGSGKTVIGVLAALRAIRGEDAKAVWLVPQRSLTEELTRELRKLWHPLGLRVVQLSGEELIDHKAAREADLWVATTEKYEAICRSDLLSAAVARVKAIVVDEIHLLGDPNRGPVLEALLARVLNDGSHTRITGLSATATNAEQITQWLGGQLVTTKWRPTKLTWQLPAVNSGTRRTREGARTQVAVDLTKAITDEGGSVLVFCGNKPAVRATALAIAAARGADVRGVSPDDLPRLSAICLAKGIGIHYRDWEGKHAAADAFRARDLDVLVATSTVAAGVNLPARAVVVRDTDIGRSRIDVATVLQMFGRAGRMGHGEREGWAYLVTDTVERPQWQAAILAGNTIVSRLVNVLADHVLAGIVLERITSIPGAETWWGGTFAHHQGERDTKAVHEALDFLVDAGYVLRGDPLAATELGKLTAKLMIPGEVGTEVRDALARHPFPSEPRSAERALAAVIATLVPQLAEAAVIDEHQVHLARLLAADGDPDHMPEPDPEAQAQPGDLARVAFALVLDDPDIFRRPHRLVAGLPSSAVHSVLEDSTRYFHWLAAQGRLGTVAPWVAVVASDMGRRIRWRRLGPRRGAGRLLWMCEKMAGLGGDKLVRALYEAARAKGLDAPDWRAKTPPHLCELTTDQYKALLADRATGAEFDTAGAVVAHPPASVALPWSTTAHPSTAGATVFSRRDDHLSSGWLGAYNAINNR
ncbi:DEAD/DEAH box helicase [Saccharothrix deserti]|uniref:DEAD/DEAH box helicase n=1 Tax=Saccharothrix deserti TaxID=2593674 RepID=UPI001EE48559|nr:DEAD/DEAH box helicase [Saccharothrix deserti]